MNLDLLLVVPYRRTERIEARLAETRERIAAAALSLVAEGGYAAASIAAVADRAGLSPGAIYRHFDSKADLFTEVFRRASQREVDVFAAAAGGADRPAAERVAAVVERFARRALRAPRLAYALIAEPVDPAVDAERLRFRRAYRDVLAGIVRDGIAAGALPPQDADLCAAAMVGAIGEALVGPLAVEDGGDAGALIASLVGICVRAMSAEPAHHPSGTLV